MTYTVKNCKHNQDNINFIDLTDPKNEMPSFLNYEEVLASSIENCNINNADEIVSLCDGGDHINPYFSSLSAAEECEMLVENSSLERFNDETGEYEEVETLFDSEVDTYELF